MGSCAGSKECGASSLWLSHDQPRLFHSPQWFFCERGYTTKGWPDVFYLAFRIFWALYLSTWLVISAILRSLAYNPPVLGVEWLIYLTDWALITVTASADVRAMVTAHAYFSYVRRGLKIKQMTWWLKTSWFVYAMSSAIALTVTLLFWTIIFKGSYPDAINVHTHAVNSVYVLLDCFVTATPVKILHFWIPVLFGIAYGLFSVAYDLLGGTNTFGSPFIYDVLDWSASPTKAVIYLIISLAVVAVAHIVLFGLSKLRILICNQCKRASGRLEPISSPAQSRAEGAHVADVELTSTVRDSS